MHEREKEREGEMGERGGERGEGREKVAEREREGGGEIVVIRFVEVRVANPTLFSCAIIFCTLPPTLVPDLTRSERVETAATAAGILITGKGGGRACTTAPDDRIASCGWYGRTLSWLPMHRVFWREKRVGM